MTFSTLLTSHSRKAFLFLLWISLHVNAQLNWPEGQLLPSFPAPASTMDLIYMNGTVPTYSKNWTWQAESSDVTHETGKAEGDGWIGQAGTHVADKYLIKSPRVEEVTNGLNFADFRLKIDNNTSDNSTVAVVDVRNVTTGTVVATQNILRQDFSGSGAYQNFTLNFQLAADNQEIELRVLWKGNSTMQVDYVRVRQDNGAAEAYLFSSMKGLINRIKPRIFSYEGDAHAEGPYAWLNSLGVSFVENKTNTWSTLSKYKAEISGLIVYDPLQNHTVSLATSLAKEKNALIASPSLLHRLTAEPYNFPVLEDLRGKFTSPLQVYQTIFDTHWDKTDKRLLIGLSPDHHKAALREYAVALGAAVIWLDPKKPAESTLLNKFLASMPKGSNYMGWWPEEQPGVDRVSNYGITTIASDYCTNLTFHSGMPRRIDPQPMPAKPELENKLYVAFIISDGDNLQYVEHRMRRFWDDPNRGSVPIGWTITPAMVDAMPGALNYFHQSSTENDNLISGPSGYGYTYPNNWVNLSLNEELADYVATTEAYNVAAGIRVITIWNTITGGIDSRVGTSFAVNSRTLLGLTAQNTGGPLSIYGSSRDPNINRLPGKPLTCNYCTGEQAMKDHIISGSNNWDGNSPRFLIIQGNPWNSEVNPTGFKNVMNYFNSGSFAGKYKFVRPDHIFQLIREHNDMEINPGILRGTGEGLTGTYFNGENFEEKVAERVDAVIDFDWGTGSPLSGVNDDNFTVRWEGQIQPSFNGHYTFYATCDGVKLWVDGKLLIDKLPGGRNPMTYTGKIDSLEAGKKYSIRIEYQEKIAGAQCKLEWASGFLPREVIPQSQLYKDQASGVTSPVKFPGLKVFASGTTLHVGMDEPADENGSVTLYDICGKKLMHRQLFSAQQQFEVGNFANGIYLLTVKSGNKLETKRFVISN